MWLRQHLVLLAACTVVFEGAIASRGCPVVVIPLSKTSKKTQLCFDLSDGDSKKDIGDDSGLSTDWAGGYDQADLMKLYAVGLAKKGHGGSAGGALGLGGLGSGAGIGGLSYDQLAALSLAGGHGRGIGGGLGLRGGGGAALGWGGRGSGGALSKYGNTIYQNTNVQQGIFTPNKNGIGGGINHNGNPPVGNIQIGIQNIAPGGSGSSGQYNQRPGDQWLNINNQQNPYSAEARRVPTGPDPATHDSQSDLRNIGPGGSGSTWQVGGQGGQRGYSGGTGGFQNGQQYSGININNQQTQFSSDTHEVPSGTNPTGNMQSNVQNIGGSGSTWQFGGQGGQRGYPGATGDWQNGQQYPGINMNNQQNPLSVDTHEVPSGPYPGSNSQSNAQHIGPGGSASTWQFGGQGGQQSYPGATSDLQNGQQYPGININNQQTQFFSDTHEVPSGSQPIGNMQSNMENIGGSGSNWQFGGQGGQLGYPGATGDLQNGQQYPGININNQRNPYSAEARRVTTGSNPATHDSQSDLQNIGPSGSGSTWQFGGQGGQRGYPGATGDLQNGQQYPGINMNNQQNPLSVDTHEVPSGPAPDPNSQSNLQNIGWGGSGSTWQFGGQGGQRGYPRGTGGLRNGQQYPGINMNNQQNPLSVDTHEVPSGPNPGDSNSQSNLQSYPGANGRSGYQGGPGAQDANLQYGGTFQGTMYVNQSGKSSWKIDSVNPAPTWAGATIQADISNVCGKMK